MIDALQQASKRLGLLGSKRKVNPDYPSYSVGEAFFGGVVNALKVLKGHLTLQILHGDLMHELAKVRLNGDHSRPAEFPRKYTRMWLSNVP